MAADAIAADPWDREWAARTAWGEARGEGPAGKAAVAWVIRNRVKKGHWGTTLALVCAAPLQFSAWNAHDPNRLHCLGLAAGDTQLAEAYAAVDAVMALGQAADPTGGATHYFAEGTPRPSWADSGRFTVQIGHHLFFADVP